MIKAKGNYISKYKKRHLLIELNKMFLEASVQTMDKDDFTKSIKIENQSTTDEILSTLNIPQVYDEGPWLHK